MAATGLLWAAVLAFFWPLITPDQASRQYFGPGDFWLQFVPFHTFAARQLAAGRLALWDPDMFSGHPFQADIQTAVTYPIAALNEWLGGTGFRFLHLEWEAVVHFGLAATFTYLLVERLTGSTPAGVLGGIVFAFSGFLTSYPSQQLPVLESTVWLPLELYCLERGIKSARWLALAGGCVALAIVAGHPQTVLYLAYLGLAYFLFRTPWRQWWRGTWAALPAAGLAAVQLLPTLQLFGINRRGNLDFGFAAGGIQWADLAGVLYDQPNGGRILYVGILPLALAVVALAVIRGRQTAFWGITAVVSLLLSLGTYGPLYRLVFFLPGWALFRDQERAVVWFALALAVLAGYGLAAILPRLSWPWEPAVMMAVVFLSYGNLLLANGENNLTRDPPRLDAVDDLLRTVVTDHDVFRVRISEDSLGHNTGNLLGLQFVTGDSPFELLPFQEWTQDQPAGNRVTEWQLLRLTNSHYVISSRELCAAPCGEADGLRLLGSAEVPAGTRILESQRGASPPARQLHLYRVLFPLPRAFFVTEARAAEDERQAIELLNAAGFDAGTTVLLHGSGVAHSAARDPNARLETDLTGYAPGFVELRTSSTQAAYLYVSEVSYPGWEATIDGQAAPLLTADGLFSALDVPAGDHHIVLQYVPKAFFLGAVISGLSLAGLAAALAWGARKL